MSFMGIITSGPEFEPEILFLLDEFLSQFDLSCSEGQKHEHHHYPCSYRSAIQYRPNMFEDLLTRTLSHSKNPEVVFNPHMTNGLSHHYYLGRTTFVFRGVRSDSEFLFHFSIKIL